MQLSLAKSLKRGILFPHTEQGRTYYLLFHKANLSGPFFVRTSDLENSSLFHIGDITHNAYDGDVVGNCFFTQAKHHSSGVFCLAYTGVLEGQTASKALKGKGFGVELVLKTPHYMMWNKRGHTTLIVTPSLSSSIRENLEI